MTAHVRQGSATTTSTDPAERARSIALRYLDHSPKSAGQVRAKLIEKDVAPDVADHIVARYREVGLLDDAALAAAIVRTRHRERGQARRAIAVELKRKLFEDDVIAAALENIDDDDERQVALEVALARWNKLSGLDSDVRVRRVTALLGRKGYGASLAYAVVKDLLRADSEGAG